MKRKASAVWRGGLKDGKGAISTESGALKSKVLEIANAAKAGCPISRLLKTNITMATEVQT